MSLTTCTPSSSFIVHRFSRAIATAVAPTWWRSLLLSMLVLFSSGCAVMFVGPYDEVTDLAIQDLTRKTETMMASVISGGDESYARHARFYREVEGDLAAIEMRASIYPKNEDELHVIGNLQTAYKNLERIHRTIGSFRLNETRGVRSLLKSLMHHELSKKRSAGIGAPSKKPSGTADTP